MRTVCNALGSIKTKWFEIGIQLGIARNKLLEFKNEHDPLSAIMDYCLRGNVAKSTAPISWDSIVAALKSDHVGEPGLAEQISKKYYHQEDTKLNKGLDPYNLATNSYFCHACIIIATGESSAETVTTALTEQLGERHFQEEVEKGQTFTIAANNYS